MYLDDKYLYPSSTTKLMNDIKYNLKLSWISLETYYYYVHEVQFSEHGVFDVWASLR